MLIRKRFKPEETVCLENDTILHVDDNIIITSWNVLKKRLDFTKGMSCYFLNRGFKVSKFMDDYNNLVYWYCDIIETEINGNIYTFNDLLIDVLIYENGKVEVVDLVDLANVYEKNIITTKQLTSSLRSLDDLLKEIYTGNFNKLTLDIELYSAKERERLCEF